MERRLGQRVSKEQGSGASQSRRMRWAGHVACVLGFMGNPEGKRTVGRPIHNGRRILKCVLKRQDGRALC